MMFSICTFNIAHGRGLAKSNWSGGSLRERKQRLDKIVQVIFDCDIVVLQEVDFCAPWTLWLLNQYAYLKRAANFLYSMTLANNYLIPRAGIVILSRFPLHNRKIIKLPQYSKVEGMLGYRKNALACTVTIKENTIRLLGIHLDYRGRLVTVPSAKQIIKYAAKQQLPIIMAGDFNATPLDYPNSQDDQPTALDILRNSGLFKTYPEADPQLHDMTHLANNQHRIIDWIFIPKTWQFNTYNVIDVHLSDHRPIKARVTIPSIHSVRKEINTPQDLLW